MEWFVYPPLVNIVVHLVFLVSFWVLAQLSRILGEALKKKPMYRLFYFSLTASSISQILLFLAGNFQSTAIILDSLALSVAIGVTIYYWKWIPAELRKG